MKQFTLILFLSIVKGLSAQKLIYSDTIPTEQIRISPDHAMGGSVSDWIQELAYYPLETQDRKDIVSYVQEFCQNDSSIAVVDRGNSGQAGPAIFIYTAQGKLIKRISLEEMGLDEHKTVNSIHRWEDGFIIGTPTYRVNMDQEGNFTKQHYATFSSTSDDSVKIHDAVWYYTSPRYMHRRSSNEALILNNEVLVWYQQDNQPSVFFDLRDNFSSLYKQEDLVYAAFSYHYKVFELHVKGVQKLYDFIFPLSYTLDIGAYYSIREEESFQTFMAKNPKAILGFDNIIRYKDYLLLETKTLAGSSFWLAYNITTKEVIRLENIVPDQSNDYLPIMGWNKKLSTDGEYLYSIIYPNEMELATRKCEEERHSMRQEYEKLLNYKNPILVRFKLN